MGWLKDLFWNFVLRQKPWKRPVFTDWPSSKDRKSIFYLPSQRSTTLHDYQFCNWVLTQTLQNSRKYESPLNSSKNQCYSFSCNGPPLIYCIKCRVNGTGGAVAFLTAPSIFFLLLSQVWNGLVWILHVIWQHFFQKVTLEF